MAHDFDFTSWQMLPNVLFILFHILMLTWTVQRGITIISILWPRLLWWLQLLCIWHLFFSVELFVLVIYARYLRKVFKNLDTANLEVTPFVIVSVYGAVSCLVVLFLEVLTGVAATYTGADMTVYTFVAFGQWILPTVYTYIQLLMKWALFRDRLRNEKAKACALELAKEIASGMLSPPSSKRDSAWDSIRNSRVTNPYPESNMSPDSARRFRSNIDLNQGRPVSWA
ncbi:hypothetical protein BCR33DRAFT_716176, partial [Rhizoclosmatium globosum]